MPEEPWQTRVIEERATLARLIVALYNFIQGPRFPALPEVDQSLLYRQYTAMLNYHDILITRIAKFPAE